MNRYRIILIASLSFNILALFFFGRKFFHTQPIHQDDFMTNLRTSQAEIFDHYPAKEGDTVFLGDSRIFDWPADMISRIKVRGTRGETVGGILQVIPHILPTKAKVIYLEIGVNDLISGIDVQTTLDKYKQVIKVFSGLHAPLIVESVIPVSKDYSALRKNVNDSIRVFNSRLKNAASESNIPFIDLSALGEKDLQDIYIYDGMHLNYAGYLKWTGIIYN